MKNKKQIYLVGKAIGSYRTQNLIKILLDNGNNIYYDGGISVTNKIKGNVFAAKILIRIIKIFERLFKIPIMLYYIILSDIIYITAMNHDKNKQFEIRLGKLLKKKIILDYYISMYDTNVLDRKNFKLNSRKANYLYKIDKRAIKMASKIIFLNRTEMRRYCELVEENYKNLDIEIVPICIDEKRYGKIKFFKNAKKEMVICWWGTYIPLHGIDSILQACKILKDKNFNFKLYLFGNSEKLSVPYKEMVEKLKIKDKVVIKNDFTFNNGKLEEFLEENCDLVLGNFGKSSKAKNVLVNKIIDGISMKIPVLNGESKAPDDFFNYKNDIFKCLNDGDSIARKIIEISNSSKEVIEERVNNSNLIYENNFSYKAYKNNIIKLIS